MNMIGAIMERKYQHVSDYDKIPKACACVDSNFPMDTNGLACKICGRCVIKLLDMCLTRSRKCVATKFPKSNNLVGFIPFLDGKRKESSGSAVILAVEQGKICVVS